MERYRTVILVLVGLLSLRFLLAEKTEQSDCNDSGLKNKDNTVIYTAKDCRPTTCEATGPGSDGLNCNIGNYIGNFPNACKDINVDLLTRTRQPPPTLDQVCQPLLSSLSLYILHCKEINIEEVALSYTFQLPICGTEDVLSSQMVKVDFNANREHNYFTHYPICRVFNYTGSHFSSHSSVSAPIEVTYKCMGIGLQDGYPEVYYYLSFTAYPSGAQLNYTIVYMDVANDSMQLLAGAWRSRRNAHIVFLPIKGINSYLVLARSGGWEVSLEVSVPTVEISEIPNSSNIVTVTVTPYDKTACQHFRYKCSPATVTLHDKNTLVLPADPPDHGQPAGVDWRYAVVVGVGSLIAIVLITATVFLCLRYHRQKQGSSPDDAMQLQQPRQPVLCITATCTSDTYRRVENLLMQHRFQMEPLKQDADCITKMRDFSIILIIIYPSLAASSGWDHFLKLIGLLFENKPLWHKVRVVSLAAEGQSYLKPSSILQNSIKNSLHLEEFLRVLDQNTYCDMPQHRDQLIESMHQTLDEETESVLQNSRDGSHEEESHSLIPGKQTDAQCPREMHHNTFGDQLSVTVHVCAVPERVPDDAESDGASSTSDPFILVDAVPILAQVPDQILEPIPGLVHEHVPDPVHGHVSEHILGQVQDDSLRHFLGPVDGQVLDPCHRQTPGPFNGQAQGEDTVHGQISVHEQAPGPVQDQISIQVQNISCDTKVEPEVSEYALRPRSPPEGCDSEETSRKQPLGQTEDMPYLGEGMRREDFEEETFRKSVQVLYSDEEDDACCRNSSPPEEGWLENTSLCSQDWPIVGQHSSGSPSFGPDLQNWSNPASGKEELCSEQTTPSSSKLERRPISQPEPPQDAPTLRQGPLGIVTDYEAAHHNPAPHGHGENISELVSASGAWHREAEEDSYHSSASNKGNSFPTQSFACGPEQFLSSHQHQTYGQGMENSNSAYKSDCSMHQPFHEKENKASGQSAPAAGFVAKGPPLTTQRFLEDNRRHDEALLARGACNSDAAAARPQGPLNSIDHPLLLRERGDGSPFQDELRQFAENLFEPLQGDARMLNNGPARQGLAVEQNAFGQNDQPERGRNQQDGRRQPVQHYYDSDEDNKDSGFSRGDSDSMN